MSEIVFGVVVFCDDSECMSNFQGKCMCDSIDISGHKCVSRCMYDQSGQSGPVEAMKGKD